MLISARAKKQAATEVAEAAARQPDHRLKNLELQYMGFVVLAAGREYNFRLHRKNEEDRGFVVTVENTGFLSGKLKFQEGPDICYRKLLHGLATEENDSPMELRQQVTESEVVEYKSTSSPKASKWTEQQREAARQRFRDRLAGH